MHRHFLTSLICTFILSSPLLLATEGRLMRYPDIHQDKIVFTYENDLWLVSSHGGTAARITSHPGSEKYAKFSPDGKKIAFTVRVSISEEPVAGKPHGRFCEGNSSFTIRKVATYSRRKTICQYYKK